MYRFGRKSLAKLDMLDPLMRDMCERVMVSQVMDFTVVWTWRGKELQNALADTPASNTRWPHSTHNRPFGRPEDGPDAWDLKPESHGVDLAPWINGAIPWKDTHTFAVLAGLCFAAASIIDALERTEDRPGFGIRWGGDWDLDGLTTDQTLMDFGHFERIL